MVIVKSVILIMTQELYEHHTRTATGAKTFGSAAPKRWQQQPDSIRSSNSLSTIKKRLKNCFLSSFYHIGAFQSISAPRC